MGPTPDIYLYGMTLLSTMHLLDGSYPEADTYREIKESYVLPGGETGNAALILANLGYQVKIDGPFLGTKTKDGILSFYRKYDIDCTGLHYDPSFDGVQDLILIDQHSRTAFGKFGKYFNSGKRWSPPDKTAIQAAKVVSIDPFFKEESNLAAEYCAAAKKKYVTIDCAPYDEIHKHAAATVISHEYLHNEFPGESIPDLLHKYTNFSDGLVIFTFGAEKILYGRKGQAIKSFVPYKVGVQSTLGAGDTFRAGVVYGVLNEYDDENAIRFAAATAALVCSRFPMALDPPGRDEIFNLMGRD